MKSISITVHPSQFPEKVQQDLLDSLAARRIQHKFHYESVKQAAKWLALHEAYSPARRDQACLDTYDQAFRAAGDQCDASVHVIGLGCGGAQKEAALLSALGTERSLAFTPVEVGVPLGIISYRRIAELENVSVLDPIMCDLGHTRDLESVLQPAPFPASRLFTCFGLLPNFEGSELLPMLLDLLRPEDRVLLSANLAPGDDYARGVRAILGGYDNSLTKDWLMTFLLDLGIEAQDGILECGIVDCPGDVALKRIQFEFCFTRLRELAVSGRAFRFEAGEKIQLFFSYRHTPELMKRLLDNHSLSLLRSWITPAGDEGIFLCGRC